MMDKMRLVRLSDTLSFNPARIILARSGRFSGGGTPYTFVRVCEGEPMMLSGEELEAFDRWLADHSTGDYLGEEGPF
jgi:hypothetical protein